MRLSVRGDKWWTLAAMCFGLFLIMLDNTIVNVALPSIQRQLHASPSTLEWTINAYVLSFAVLILVGGKLGDRFGRKRIFLVGLLIFTAMSAACALAPTAGWLVAFRAGQGVGGALMNPLTLSILVATFDQRQLGTAIGIWAGISALALAIGPVVGGLLVQHVDWSAIFWINVPIGLVGALVTLWAVAESRDPGALRMDLPGVALVTGGLFCIVWGLIETNSHAWGSAYTIGFLAAGLALIGAFVAWESRTRTPMIPLEFFKRPAFSASSMLVAFVGLSLFGVIFFITLYFQNVKGWSPTQAGLRTLPLTMMVMIVGPLAGKLQVRFSARGMMTLGMLLTTAGLVGLSQIQVDSSYNQIWPFYVLMGGGLALTMPTTAATAMNAVDRDKSGIASGVVNASRQVGAALGLAILGAVGATLTSDAWSAKVARLPAGLQAQAHRLDELVIGGQVQVVGRLAGPRAATASAESFVHGVHGAMWVGAGLTLAAALTAFIGLRGTSAARPAPADGPARVAVEA
jgi:EmrB/QacA subfamily drug resistance transporter